MTEIRAGHGEVRVRRAGEADWRAPQPLLALGLGDQVRVGGAPAGETGGDRVRALLSGLTQFLLGQQKEPTYRSLTTRTPRQPPLILSPRDSRLLSGQVRFEWRGADYLRYTVRVVGPQGLVWEEASLPRQPDRVEPPPRMRND